MASNPDSDKIVVFPCTSRKGDSSNVQGAKLLSEENIVGILNHITGGSNYVISHDSVNRVIKFVLGGYYFEYAHGSAQTTINAKLVMKDDSHSILGDDNTSGSYKFYGVDLDSSQVPPEGYFQLIRNGEVPSGSMVAFSGHNLPKSIKCKNLN